MRQTRALPVLIVTQGLSLVGSRMTGIAIGLWLFQQTGRTAFLLYVSLFNELPAMLAGSLAGILVDRWPRRKVLLLSDAGQALGSLLLLFCLGVGIFQVWQLYAVVFVQGCFALLQGPATDAAVTMLARKEQLERVNAVRQMLFPLAGLIAPVTVGLLYALIGIEGIVLADLLTFAVSAISLAAIVVPDPVLRPAGNQPEGALRQESLKGWSFLWAHRALLGLVLYFSWTNLLLNGPLELALPYLLRITDDQLLMALLLGLMNFGALLGAGLTWLLPWRRQRVSAILVGMLASGSMLVLFGIARHPILLGVALVLLMIPLPMCGALFTSVLQRRTPPDLQGRVFAAAAHLAFLFTPLSFLVTGPLVDRVVEPAVGTSAWRRLEPLFGAQAGSGMGLILSAAGLLILIGTWLAWSFRPLRELERQP